MHADSGAVDTYVAPHAGAWIETPTLLALSRWICASHPTRVRGLKPGLSIPMTIGETSHPTRVRGLKRVMATDFPRRTASHPTRVRGLKQAATRFAAELTSVAPHAGAWIETVSFAPLSAADIGRTPRGCVD